MAVSTFDDEAERLVRADELLARGDLHGELIVVQCELARGGFSRERGIALRKRERELLGAHAEEWADLEALASKWTFRRGFVDEIWVNLATFIEHEDEIWRRAPYLRWLRFTVPTREWERIPSLVKRALESGRVRYFEAPSAAPMENGSHLANWLRFNPEVLERLRGMKLPDIDEDDLRPLLYCDEAGGLEELEVYGRVSNGVAYGPHPTLRPRRLLLDERGGTGLEENYLRALFSTAFPSRLVELHTSTHLESILEHEWVENLRSLHVSHDNGWRAFEALAATPRLAKLEHLEIDCHPARERNLDIEPLYEPAHLEALRTLRIGQGVSPDRARNLLRSPLAQRLELIDLSASKLPTILEESRFRWDGVLVV